MFIVCAAHVHVLFTSVREKDLDTNLATALTRTAVLQNCGARSLKRIETSSMTKRNAENAGNADSLMKESNPVVTTANTSMGRLTESMQEISKAGEETSKIIKIIDEDGADF
jgi:hypothetical protein